ncbi:ferredoxin [Candidatus Uhrbacteria bacterium]|nr:ferredoxin [Candidatus Uhrbacteria bacterium]
MARIAKIVIDRDLCIGAASCVTIMPTVFQLDEENKAVLVAGSDAQWEDTETVLMAAQSCPTKAIFLYDEAGNQLYPES